MRILYLLPCFPYPPTDGIGWKLFNLLSYMAQRHECHVLSFGAPDALEQAADWCQSLPGLRILGVFPLQSGWRLAILRAWHIVQGHQPSLARWDNQDFARALRCSLELHQYDIIHCDILNLAQYLPIFDHLPTVLSTNDSPALAAQCAALSTRQPLLKARLAFSWWRIAAFERKVFPKFTKLHFVSQAESDHVKSHYPNVEVETIPLAVGDEFLEYAASNLSISQISKREASSRILFFSGSLSVENIARGLLRFLDCSWKPIQCQFPDAKLIVIGRNAPGTVVKRLKRETGVMFYTWVDDYLSALSQADVVISPDLAGTGIKTRVLQAMAAGKPVVGTSAALSGIDLQDGKHAFVCDEPATFTEATLRLLGNPDLRFQLGRAAHEFVKRYHSQEATGRRWEHLYESVIEKFRDVHQVTATS